jgi:hypothetical protein
MGDPRGCWGCVEIKSIALTGASVAFRVKCFRLYILHADRFPQSKDEKRATVPSGGTGRFYRLFADTLYQKTYKVRVVPHGVTRTSSDQRSCFVARDFNEQWRDQPGAERLGGLYP